MTFGNDNSVTLNNEGSNSGIAIASNHGTVNVNCQLAYGEIRTICLDLIQGELAKYKADALVEAQNRNTELFNLLLVELRNNGTNDKLVLDEFKNPGMQIDYYEAQKGYIRTGSPELAKMLSGILVKRIHETSRTMLQIALSEAIQTVPKLLPSQMAVLAFVLAVRHLYPNTSIPYSKEDFICNLKHILLPLFQKGVSKTYLEIQHLHFTSCVLTAGWSETLISILKNINAFFFMKGFLPSYIQKDENGNFLNDLYPDLFIECVNDKKLLQINALNENDLRNKLGVNHKHFQIFKKIFYQNMMKDEEAQRFVENLFPEMKEVFTYWNGSWISSCVLSSVGVVIGAEYLRQITGKIVDIDEWLQKDLS